MRPQRKLQLTLALGFLANIYTQAGVADLIPGIEYEKFLLPTVVFKAEPGAFGSLWVTRLSLTNSSTEPVFAYPHDESQAHIDPAPLNGAIPPNTTVALVTSGDIAPERGTFFFVDKRFLQNVQFSLRAQDLSRQSLTWGTSIPVPRQEEFRNGTITLTDIPTDVRFRQTLRVYSLDSSKPSTVRISVFGIRLNTDQSLPVTDVLLGSQDRALSDHHLWLPINTLTIPGFLEISGITSIAPVAGYDLVRIDVQPLDTSSLWAFVSITNNETQHITVIAPTP